MWNVKIMQKRSTFDKVIILSVIIILFYVGILVYSDLNEIASKFSSIKLEFFPIIFSLMGIQLVTLGIKYHRMLGRLEIKLPLLESIKIFLSGISLIATPGGAGTAIKSQILKKKFDIPISTTLPVIFMERLTELLAILIILTIFLFWVINYTSLIAILIGSFFVLITGVLISNNKIFQSLKTLFTKFNKIKKFVYTLDESKESFNKLTKKNTVLESLGWSIIAKIAQLTAAYFIFLSLNVDLGFILSGQIYYTSLVVGALTFIPSGIIITESTMLALLIEENIEFSLATLVVVFTRLITTWMATIIGIITLKLSYAKL